MITPLPGATTLKPGSATLPFFGVEPALLDDKARSYGTASAPSCEQLRQENTKGKANERDGRAPKMVCGLQSRCDVSRPGPIICAL